MWVELGVSNFKALQSLETSAKMIFKRSMHNIFPVSDNGTYDVAST